MFDSVRNSKRVVQIILLLIILPFALWGMESYFRNLGPGQDIATVGGSKISPADFQQSMREQQDRLRAALGRDFSPAMLETPEARRALLDSIVNQRLLRMEASGLRLATSDQQLHDVIVSIPSLQVDGKFARSRYEQLLRAQGMSEAVFEARLRQDLTLQQLGGAIGESAMVSKAEAARWAALQQEEREISEARLAPEQFAAQVKLNEDALKAYYEANRKQFEIPEQVRVQYVVLSPAALLSQVSVPEQELRSWYDSHLAQYRQQEERRASHILIMLPKDASPEAAKEARAKAEGIHKAVRQNPAQFEKLARERSQDEGSAKNGGDLGFFARGAMVKAFEDAAFTLKQGEISEIVQSEFGFHIIKLTGIKPESQRSFEEARPEIELELKQQAAGRKFAELAETFANTLYEQSDSLKPAADKFKLNIRESDWMSRTTPAPGDLANEKLLAALFSDDAVTKRRNTEAIEIAPNTLMGARVLEHKPAAMKPFDTVRAEIDKRLVREEASKLARKDGEEKLARLVKGESAELVWTGTRKVRRSGDAAMAPQAVRDVFKADTSKLPAYVGAEVPGGGYAVYRISAVSRPQQVDPNVAAAIREQLARYAAEQDFGAYLAALRTRYPVELNRAALDGKER